MSSRPLIGVLGGLGPAATVDFYAKVVAAAAAAGVASDQEHVRLIIDGDPEVPNRNDSVAGRGPSSAPALVAKALRLKSAGAEVLVMACNAAHAYQAEVAAASGLPLVSLVEVAVEAALAAAPGARLVGVLAATGTLDAGLYQRALVERGAVGVEPDPGQRERFMDLLYRIKAGEVQGEVRREMATVAEHLAAAGAEVIIAACTEVPLVLGAADVSVPLVDAGQELAAAVVRLGAAPVP